jgi:hypothetical protein
MAASWSLSPNSISSVETVSFSLNQGVDRAAHVEVALAVGHVGVREQHLRHGDAVAREGLLVGEHQAGLPDGSRRLQLRQRARA